MISGSSELLGLWELFAANARVLEALEADSTQMIAVSANLARNTRNFASEHAPWLTGTLSSAHRGIAFAEGDKTVAEIFIDSTVQNPVFGGYPVDYGPDVHVNQPWFDWTQQFLVEEVFPGLESELLFLVVGEWSS